MSGWAGEPADAWRLGPPVLRCRLPGAPTPTSSPRPGESPHRPCCKGWGLYDSENGATRCWEVTRPTRNTTLQYAARLGQALQQQGGDRDACGCRARNPGGPANGGAVADTGPRTLRVRCRRARIRARRLHRRSACVSGGRKGVTPFRATRCLGEARHRGITGSAQPDERGWQSFEAVAAKADQRRYPVLAGRGILPICELWSPLPGTEQRPGIRSYSLALEELCTASR